MNVAMLLEMAADAFGDRRAVGDITYTALLDRARRAAGAITDAGVDRVAFVDVNSEAVPVLLFASALSGRPFAPLNYRLADDALRAVLERVAPAVAVVGEPIVERVGGTGAIEVWRSDELAARLGAPVDAGTSDPDDVAVLLFTSGTTGQPKGAVLRHRHLTSYVLDTVEFMGAGDDEATLVSVPPYHVAGLAAVLSSVYAGRRLVYLPQFSPDAWVDLASAEAVTHAMVVPTMLGRILDVLDERGERLPALRHLSYGGGRMPVAVVERALELLPHVGFVNAYGLTETSSTVAVLGPDDHREAAASDDPAVRARLGSVGRALPNLDLEIRDPYGAPLPPGEKGEIHVRGEQVAGEYLDRSVLGDDGWFATNDGGWLDADGFLYVDGRLDDVIVRGAENLSPGEIEDTLAAHPAVAEAAVVGVPDEEWGEAVAAVVVLELDAAADEVELQEWVRQRLRSSRVPATVTFRDDLPYNETGKLLRRVLKDDVAARLTGGRTSPTP